jgi:predicted acylesterase/phospholipase RssA/CRP-like cAMP-binding protein
MTGISSLINRFNVVKQIPIFNKLNWFELQKIARNCIIQEYKKGDIIRKEGDPADYFYCLVSGRILAYTLNSSQLKENMEYIHRGMHFGMISVFTGESHSLNFEALNDSVILKIDKAEFHELLKSVPQLGIEFTQSLSKRVRSHVKGVKSIFESTIIAIYSALKGTGSSTYAIHLALSLSKETKKKVILVNIHTRQNDHSQDEISPKWKDAIDINEIIDDPERIFQNIIRKDTPIDLLNVVFDANDLSLKKHISPLVSTLVGAYHYVMVDLPNDMDDFVMEILNQSDIIHLVAADRRKDLELARNVINRLQSSFKENFRAEKIHVIIRSVHEKMYMTYEEIHKTLDFSVHTYLPQMDAQEFKNVIETKILMIHQCDEHTEYSKAIKRIARQIGGVMVGVVLGGGAALGVAHVGVIRVLEEENIPVDIVAGSSMGALIASLWAIGKNAAELEKVAREFEKQTGLLKLFELIIPIKGLIGERAIRRWLYGHLGNNTFESAKFPLKIIAYDLVRREELVITEGSLVEAVRRSIAIPGVLPPICEDERIIIDGGVLNPLPTNVLARCGVKKIIAINVLQSPQDVSDGHDMEQHKLREIDEIPFRSHPFKFISIRIGKFFSKIFTPNIPDIIVRTLQATEYVIAEQSAHQADIVIHPNLVGINWFELYRVDDLIRHGEEATRKALPKIKKLIEVAAENSA